MEFGGCRRPHTLVVRNGETVCSPYWEFNFHQDSKTPDEEEAAERLEHLLREAVRRRPHERGALGAFLSGGIDSSTVVAFMAQLSDRPVQTFANRFRRGRLLRARGCRIVARHLGTDHHEMIVKPSELDALQSSCGIR